MSKCEHVELSTDDPNGAKDFYAKLFGWKYMVMPGDDNGPDYAMFQTDNGGGGITAKMAPQQPTAWMPYFTVKSVNKALEAAQGLGANVALGFTPIGENGAIAVLIDPTGASFGVWEAAPKPAAPPKAKKPAAKKPAAKKPAAKAKKPAAKAKKPAAKPKKKAKR